MAFSYQEVPLSGMVVNAPNHSLPLYKLTPPAPLIATWLTAAPLCRQCPFPPCVSVGQLTSLRSHEHAAEHQVRVEALGGIMGFQQPFGSFHLPREQHIPIRAAPSVWVSEREELLLGAELQH